MWVDGNCHAPEGITSVGSDEIKQGNLRWSAQINKSDDRCGKLMVLDVNSFNYFVTRLQSECTYVCHK